MPHELIRQHVDTRATERGIEIFHQGKRVAVHQRRYGGTKHGTDIQHMPSAHRRYGEWTPERFRRWGATIGPNTEGLITAILESDIFTLIHFQGSGAVWFLIQDAGWVGGQHQCLVPIHWMYVSVLLPRCVAA